MASVPSFTKPGVSESTPNSKSPSAADSFPSLVRRASLNVRFALIPSAGFGADRGSQLAARGGGDVVRGRAIRLRKDIPAPASDADRASKGEDWPSTVWHRRWRVRRSEGNRASDRRRNRVRSRVGSPGVPRFDKRRSRASRASICGLTQRSRTRARTCSKRRASMRRGGWRSSGAGELVVAGAAGGGAGEPLDAKRSNRGIWPSASRSNVASTPSAAAR